MPKKIKVERVFTSDKKKDGSPLGFMKYSVKVGDEWFELKGDGKEAVQEGDEIMVTKVATPGKGNYVGRTFYHLELAKVTFAHLSEVEKRIKKLEKFVNIDEAKDIVDPGDIPF